MPPSTDGGFARWLAGQAGELLLSIRDELGFADPDALRAAGDRRSHELIVSELAQARPHDAVLSEEGVDDPARLTADRVWIVDPLDGTREFGEPGRTDWAVHIGLWSRGDRFGVGGRGGSRGAGKLAAGAVALPAQHMVLATDAPPPYPALPTGRGNARLRLAASRTRPPAFLSDLAEQLDADLVAMGSAGAKIVAVISGTVDAYVHAGGQHEWDSAAPVAVATATGLHASRLSGATLEYNQSDPRLPDLVVCRKALAPRLLAALTKCGV
jgi:3'(2'), 5'-bisphosphate nucleotidase